MVTIWDRFSAHQFLECRNNGGDIECEDIKRQRMSVNGWKYGLILYQVVFALGILGMKRLLGNDTQDCHGHLHN